MTSAKEMPVKLVTRCHFPQALPLRFGRFAMNSQSIAPSFVQGRGSLLLLLPSILAA